jgi:hypothetical protein
VMVGNGLFGELPALRKGGAVLEPTEEHDHLASANIVC